MRILVVGCGAVGLYFGGRLTQGQHHVEFLRRKPFDIGEVAVESCAGDFSFSPSQLDSIDEPYDVVLWATKAFAVGDVIHSHPQLALSKWHLSLQNGLGTEERLSEAYGNNRVLGGSAFICADRTAPNRVKHTGAGRMICGSWSNSSANKFAAAAVVTAFKHHNFDIDISADIHTDLWKKLLWNIGFNPVTALTGARVGPLLASCTGEQYVRRAMEELIDVAQHNGIGLLPSHVEKNIEMSRDMGEFRTSMLADVEAKRRVEVEAITGAVIERAVAANTSVPTIAALHELLQIYNESL